MPGESGVTVVTTLVCYLHFAREAAGASGTRHSLRPLFSKGEWFMHNSGASRRENAKLCLDVIARSEATKQSILPLLLYGLLRFARNDVQCLGCLKVES